ncbi:glycosyltransferase [Streptomyces tirandamycinicus]|uniref:glycosyltransferase n=1 Tax=Streptomyces tirandamycinicus TaxID=2174846 RepID=UPI003447FE3B
MSGGSARRRVVVVQPYVPNYRTAFFQRVHACLDAEGVALEVLHGPPLPGHEARRDPTPSPWTVQLPARRVPLPRGRYLIWHQVQRRASSADAVVLEQALHNVETYPLLARHMTGRASGRSPRVAFWGHGRTYTRPSSRLGARLKDTLSRQGAWFFAYTEGGATHLASRGFPQERITVVRNSADTRELAAHRERAEQPGTAEHAEAQALRQRYGLVPGRTALFLGGLDRPKRIPFLLDSANRIAGRLPGFRLLVAGDGIEQGLVAEAASRPGRPVVAVGRATGRSAALLGAVSDVMLMPGRVGLCAVDSFALRTPIITTDWRWHAPEFEYLVDGRNAAITPDHPAAFAAAAAALMHDPARLASLSAACATDAADYTAEGMATRFCDGVLRMISRR